MYRIFLLFFLFSCSAFSSENTPPQISSLYQFSFENITLPKSERLGLVGLNYLVEKKNWYTGLGVYGAVTGQRGGFFTGGLHFGKSFPLINGYYLDGNAFVGGGGGGSAPQGGGLMLRAAAGVVKQLLNNQYFLGVSRVSFPNGDIDSNQLTFAYSRQFTSLHFSGWFYDYSALKATNRWDSKLKNYQSYSQQVSMQILNYYPGDSVRGRDSRLHENVLSVLGIRFSQKLSKSLWGEFETAGAMSGGIDGFAQVLGGLSTKYALNQKISLAGGLLIGAAGGGNVDTGGGVIARVYSGVEVALFRRWSTFLHFGYINAPDGGFSARTINLNFVYHFQNLSPDLLGDFMDQGVTENKGKSTNNSLQGEAINWRKLRVRPGVQKYTFYARNSRKFEGQKDYDVDLTNLKLDAFINSSVFITGQALGAFKGKAGGYAVGFLGSGVQFSRFVGAEMLFGVAGGGGIAVGSGKIIQPMLNFELPHSKQWSSEFSVGYIKAVDDDLSAYVFNLGLVYRFTQPYY